MGNCHPEKTNVDPGKAEVDIGFRGVTISWTMLPSRAVNIYDIILNVNYIHRLHYVWLQNNQSQVNIRVCISYSVNSNAQRRQSERMVNRKRINSAQSNFFFFGI